MKCYNSMTTPIVTDTEKELSSPTSAGLKMFSKKYISLASSVKVGYKLFPKTNVGNYFCS